MVAGRTRASGAEASEPFTGKISFVDQLHTTKGGCPIVAHRAGRRPDVHLPHRDQEHRLGTVKPVRGSPARYAAEHQAPGPERQPQQYQPPPAPGVAFPYYVVPPYTSALHASLTGNVPVTFDLGTFTGDPDLSPAVATPGTSGSTSGDSARLAFQEPEISPGVWYLNPMRSDRTGPVVRRRPPPAPA